MAKTLALTGNSAIAYAMKQIEPDVCAAYPITPSTQVMEDFSKYVANGEVKTNLVTVESEHSAMSACIGASAAGARVMTATSGQGLAYMWEMLWSASGARLPVVMIVVNRGMNLPLNIHCGHDDSFGARDTGWIQIYSENAQECYDNIIQAIRIAEHPDVQLPAMVMQDGFIISHSIQNVNVIETKDVKDFVGERKPVYSVLDVKNPVTVGPVDLPNYYIEHKRQQVAAMENAMKVIMDISDEFYKRFKRRYGYFEEYRLDDADICVVILNSAAGATKVAVDELRKKGIKAGVLKPRLFRPFPAERLRDALKGIKAIAVLERTDSFGAKGGPLFSEIRSALYPLKNKPVVINRIYGLGGRDYLIEDALGVFEELRDIVDGKKDIEEYKYITIRNI